ncbi:MAG: YlbL family protein [Leucobacter sp.]
MQDQARERRRMRWLLAATGLAVIVLLAALIPSPYAIERPGPVVNTLSDVTIEDTTGPVIEIEGADTYPTEGALNLLTVTIVGSNEHPASWLSLIPTLVDDSQRAVRLSELYPEELTDADRQNMNTAMMNSSQRDATAAALSALGEQVPATLRVAGVAEGGPAEGVLRDGDIVLRAGGQTVDDYELLRDIIADSGAGTPLNVEVERDGATVTEHLTPEVLADSDAPMLGVGIASEYDLPVEAEISLDEIGGPSAGMIFALAIYDQLTPGTLTGGLSVSGTGTITGAGSVGAIGGLEQKLWGAARAGTDLFLLSNENCGDLPSGLPSDTDMLIAPVATLEEAISATETVTDGGTPPGIEVCEID